MEALDQVVKSIVRGPIASRLVLSAMLLAFAGAANAADSDWTMDYLPEGPSVLDLAVAETAAPAPKPPAPTEESVEALEDEGVGIDEGPVPTDEPAEPGTWSASANVGTSTSMAMFHPTEYVRSSGRSLAMSVGGTGAYRMTEKLSASLRVGAAYHLVNPKDLSGRRYFLSDPSVGISHAGFFQDEAYTGIRLSGGLNASAGLSPASRHYNRYGSLSGSLNAGRAFIDGRLSASWSLSLGVSFSRYKSPTAPKLSDDGLDMALARADGSQLLAGRYNLVAGNAQLGSMGNTFSLQVRAMEGLSASVSFGISHGYRYCPPIDHLSPQSVDNHGDPVVRQGDVCRSDGMTGSLGVSYALGGGYSLAANMNSAQPVFAYRGTSLTEDSRVMRFPWWDPDLHMTSFSMRVSKSF